LAPGDHLELAGHGTSFANGAADKQPPQQAEQGGKRSLSRFSQFSVGKAAAKPGLKTV